MHAIPRRVAAAALLAALAAGCATTRTPATIVVADKDVQSRWESEVVGFTDSPVGRRAVPVRRETIVRQYWVKGTDGKWYEVGKDAWEAAKIGEPLELHAALPEREPISPSIFPCVGPDHRWRC